MRRCINKKPFVLKKKQTSATKQPFSKKIKEQKV